MIYRMSRMRAENLTSIFIKSTILLPELQKRFDNFEFRRGWFKARTSQREIITYSQYPSLGLVAWGTKARDSQITKSEISGAPFFSMDT